MSRQIGVTILGLLSSVFIAKSWGIEGSGWYFLCFFLSNLAFNLTAAGVPAAITYCMASKTTGFDEIVPWVLRKLPIVFLAQGSVIYFYSIYLSDRDIPSYTVIGLVVLLSAISTTKELLLAVLQSRKEMQRYNQCLAVESFSTLSILLLSSLLNFDMLTSIFLAVLVAPLIGFSNIALSTLKQFGWSKPLGKPYKPLMSFAVKTYPSVLVAFLNNRFSVVFITAFFSIEALGIFSIALTLSEKLLALARSASLSIFPRVAEDKSSANTYVPIVASLTFWTTTLGAITLALLAEFIIIELYGEDFRKGILFLYIFCSSIPFFAVNRVLAQDISGRGRPEINIITSSIALLTNITLCFILHDEFGLIGIVIAYACSMLVNTLLKVMLWRLISKQAAITLFVIDVAFIKNYFKSL